MLNMSQAFLLPQPIFKLTHIFIVKGEKKFYLIRPTPENLEKFKNWMKDESQPYKYFGDCVDHCYESVVNSC